MNYRNIEPPENLESLTDSEDWVAWAVGEGILLPIAPRSQPVCRLCYGAVGVSYSGESFPFCPQCRNYMNPESIIDGLVPIAYSVDSGLESMLHEYKDWGPGRRWMAIPLGCVLREFLDTHLGCIEDRFGHIEMAVPVPSASSNRDFDHLELLTEIFDDWPVEWRSDILEKSPGGRPERGVVSPDLFQLQDGIQIEGRTVLLFDDTWTSGSSLVSAAARLRMNGVGTIVGLTLGRQLHSGFENASQLIDDARALEFDNSMCVLHDQ